MIKNVIITGIGGQGVVTAASLLREAALIAGFRLAGQDNRGGAQRLGHVAALIRFTDEPGRPLSPEIPDGECDLLISLEASEGLRYARSIGRNTFIVHGTRIVIPTNQRRARLLYVTLNQCQEAYRQRAQQVLGIDLDAMAREAFRKPVLGKLIALGAGCELWLPRAMTAAAAGRLLDDQLEAWKLGCNQRLLHA